MWDKVIPLLPAFHSAVLTAVDTKGYPFSVRCLPTADAAANRFLITPLPLDLQAGKASLLYHTQGEHINQLKSFLLRGTLTTNSDLWVFEPSTFVPGVGIGGFFAQMRFLREGKRAAKCYLEQRGLPYPKPDWEDEEAYLRGNA